MFEYSRPNAQSPITTSGSSTLTETTQCFSKSYDQAAVHRVAESFNRDTLASGLDERSAKRGVSERVARIRRGDIHRDLNEIVGKCVWINAMTLPALQQALKMHRVTYTAQEAILKIKKEPVPAWF